MAQETHTPGFVQVRNFIEGLQTQKFSDALMAKTVLPFIPRKVTPNEITWVRILLLPFIAYFLYIGNYAFGLVLFALAAATDSLDGAMARTRHQVTDVGNILDAVADWGLVAIASLMLLPRYFGWWLVAWLFAFEIFSIAMAYRSFVRTKHRPEHNWAGKLKMIFQCAAFLMVLATIFWGYEMWLRPALALFLISLVLSVFEAYLYP